MTTQAQRSAATRTRLLEATVSCLVQHGYRGTSSAEICRSAGVSRGAQLHHYPTKAELFADAVEHLFARRLGEFAGLLRAAPAGAKRLDAVLDALLELYTSPEHAAWLELVLVARTDPELRAHVAATGLRLEEAAAEVFVEGMGLSSSLPARPIVCTIMAWMDGLAVHTALHDDPAAVASSRAVMRALVAPWVEALP